MNYETFVANFHKHHSENPNACVAKGIDALHDELPDPSTEYERNTLQNTKSLLGQLDALENCEHTFDARLDLDLARLSLQAQVHGLGLQFNDRSNSQQKPSAGDDIGDGIFVLFANDPRPPAERLLNITARLEKVPDYLQKLLRRLDQPIGRWAAMDQEKVAGLPSLFSTLHSWAKETRFSDLARFEKAKSAAENGLQDYQRRLSALPTSAYFHLEETDARAIIRNRGIDLSLSELHAMATSFVQETRLTIEDLRTKLVTKYKLPSDTPTQQVHDFLNKRFRAEAGNLDRILDMYHREKDRILAFIHDRKLFPILPNQELRVLRTPTFMEPSIPAGAMMSPPPFREGTRVSLIYITLRDDLVDEHTQISIPTMMIHEGIPGHHLQLATASTHPSTIRRHFDAMEHAEGWTTMLEDYMLDLGYLEDRTDEARFCGKRDLSRIAARVAIDLYFMTGNRSYLDIGVPCDVSNPDPFEAAGALLYATTGFTPGRVQAELNWYSQERGYPLCYLTGNQLVWQLKSELGVAQQGKRTGQDIDRLFHQTYLQSGNMPVTFLRRVFQHQGYLD